MQRNFKEFLLKQIAPALAITMFAVRCKACIQVV